MHRHLGCEVRPNETNEANQPWQLGGDPRMGLAMAWNFYLKDLAADCAHDNVPTNSLLRAAIAPFRAARGSVPDQPQAIK